MTDDEAIRHVRRMLCNPLQREHVEREIMKPFGYTQGELTEWKIDSIGGGITGSRSEIQTWLEGWRSEYGDTFDETIHVYRRFPAGRWQPTTLEAVDG